MITERGIYHNLQDSSYIISNGDVSLYFSSKIYMLKFLHSYKKNRKENERRVGRFAEDSNLQFDTWFDVLLYRSIEKRGYYVTVWHKKSSCVEWGELEKYALSKVNVEREWVRK
jgi:sarcosine oxidase delta subunit